MKSFLAAILLAFALLTTVSCTTEQVAATAAGLDLASDMLDLALLPWYIAVDYPPPPPPPPRPHHPCWW